jgi:hypothetical protein
MGLQNSNEAGAELDVAADRIKAASDAGSDYTTNLETIRNNLDQAEDAGTTLGNMVGSQLQLVEAETRYQVQAGVPNKAAKAVKAAAGELKQAAG